MKNPSTTLLALGLVVAAVAAARADASQGFFDSLDANQIEGAVADPGAANGGGLQTFIDLPQNCAFVLNAQSGTVMMNDFTTKTNSDWVPLGKTDAPLSDADQKVLAAYNAYLASQKPMALSAAGLAPAGAPAPAPGLGANGGAFTPGANPFRPNAAFKPAAAGSTLSPQPDATPTSASAPQATAPDAQSPAYALANSSAFRLGGSIGTALGTWLAGPASGKPAVGGFGTSGAGGPAPARATTVVDGSSVGSPSGFTPLFGQTRRAAGITARLAPAIINAAGLTAPGAAPAPNADTGDPQPRGDIQSTTNNGD